MWKKSKPGMKLSGIAGSLGNKGYIRLKVDGRQYQAHRVAWLIMTGEWPENDIDHINHDRADNRFINLREATCMENARNQKLRKTNKSGVCGVRLNKKKTKWDAQIQVVGKIIHLGAFDKFENAVKVRKEAEEKYGFHPNHGL